MTLIGQAERGNPENFGSHPDPLSGWRRPPAVAKASETGLRRERRKSASRSWRKGLERRQGENNASNCLNNIP